MSDVGQHRWDDDELLLAELAEAVRAVTPLSDTIAEQAHGALAWRTVDSDLLLASLTFDSSLEPAGRTRAAEDGSRVLTFTAAPLMVEVELQSDRIVGQIVPPGEGEIVLESADGTTARTAADAFGFFVLPVRPEGSVRLRCDTPKTRLVTDWFAL